MAQRGLWTTSQWSPMPVPAARQSTKWPRARVGVLVGEEALRPSNFFFSPQFRDLVDIREAQSERDIQESQKRKVDGHT